MIHLRQAKLKVCFLQLGSYCVALAWLVFIVYLLLISHLRESSYLSLPNTGLFRGTQHINHRKGSQKSQYETIAVLQFISEKFPLDLSGVLTEKPKGNAGVFRGTAAIYRPILELQF